VRVGLEAGQLASWLYHGLKARSWPATCIDARHARAALSLKVNKTDANDALGLAQVMRVGWYREVAVKGHDCQAQRALLIARAQIVSQITTLKNCVRGILKVFGHVHVLPKKLRATYIVSVREITNGDTTPEPILDPMLRTLAAAMEQLQVSTGPSSAVHATTQQRVI
jgi:transposase